MSPILFELSMPNYSCYLVSQYSPRGYTCSTARTTERSRALGYTTARDRLCDAALALGLYQSLLAATD